MKVRPSFVVVLIVLLVSGWWIIRMPVFPIGKVGTSLSPDPERLRHHVLMLSESFVPRNEAYPENLERAANYLREQLKLAGARVEDQAFRAGGKIYKNIIASYGPDSGERIVIGAHYDAFSIYPAADDNASGVAGLLELARLLQRKTPKLRVDLVAFTLEEPPYFRTELMGSSVYAQSLKTARVKVRGMISLEMIGYFTESSNSQHFPNKLLQMMYPSKGNFITVVGRFSDVNLTRTVKKAMKGSCTLPVYSLSAPSIFPGIDFSDHMNFWNHGYPAVMVTDTAFFRNTAYHTPEDTADRLDFSKMADVVEGVYAAVNVLAK
jgi:Zn-dependent M28 family amino/carboxypeptidase